MHKARLTGWGQALAACALMAGFAAGETPKSVAPIYAVENAITVDGKATDWEWAPTLGMEKYAHHVVIDEYGKVADFWARCDANFLYVAFKVKDSSPGLNKRLRSDRWEGDQIELCLCTDPKDHAQHAGFTNYDYQLFLGPDADGKVSVFVNQNPAKNGMVLRDSQAAVAVWPDKQGYDLEAKVPWASLNRPDYFRPEAGVEIGWQIQIDFGTPDGEKLAFTAKWHPFGIHFQNPSSWGSARFMKPNEMLPAKEEEVEKEQIAAGRAEIAFDVPEAGLVSVNVMAADGSLVRRTVIGQQMEKGNRTAIWNGLDEEGNPVGQGTYDFVGIVSNVDVKYLTTLANTSPEPYGGCRQSSGGEYRHGSWSDLIMNPDGTFYVLNEGGEGPPSILLIDPANNYRVAWGGSTAVVGNEFQQFGARDDKFLYFIQLYSATKDGKNYSGQMLSKMDAQTRKCVPFAGGEWTVKLADTEVPIGPWDVLEREARGIAAAGGKVLVPIFSANRIDVYDPDRGTKLTAFTAPELKGPSDVWVCRDGSLLVVDKQSVHRFGIDGKFLGTAVAGLKQGWAVTEGPEGEIIVGDVATHQVKFFDKNGKLLKAMGPEGGAVQRGKGPAYTVLWGNTQPAAEWIGGPVADDRFFRPLGVAADAKGNLVVVDSGNIRVQYFDKAGTCRKSLIAQTYTSALVDPNKPNVVFAAAEHGILRQYDMNWDTGESRLVAQWSPIPTAPIGTQFVRFRGDQPYFFTGGRTVYTIQDGKVRLCSVMSSIAEIPIWADGKIAAKKLDGWLHWDWRDANGDGLPQENEFKVYPQADAKPFWQIAYPHEFHVEDDWDIVTKVDEGPEGRVIRIPFKGFDPKGNPIYSWQDVQLVFEGGKVDPKWTADLSGGKPEKPSLGGLHLRDDGWMFLLLNDRPRFQPIDCRLRAYSPQGKRMWSICKATRGFWDKPGVEISFCMQMPATIDQFVFVTDTPGAMHVFTQEGLYAGTLCEPGDMAPELYKKDARYRPMGEMWFAHVFRNPANKRSYLLAQPNAEPLVLVYEVTGLEQAKRFSGKCTLTPLEKK